MVLTDDADVGQQVPRVFRHAGRGQLLLLFVQLRMGVSTVNHARSAPASTLAASKTRCVTDAVTGLTHLAEVDGAAPGAAHMAVELVVHHVVHALVGRLPLVVQLVAPEQVLRRRPWDLFEVDVDPTTQKSPGGAPSFLCPTSSAEAVTR